MIMSKVIMGIQVKERMQDAPKLQSILSQYGCSINTRLGLHMATLDSCSPSGLIILEFVEGADEEIAKAEKELNALGGIVIKKMIFE